VPPSAQRFSSRRSGAGLCRSFTLDGCGMPKPVKRTRTYADQMTFAGLDPPTPRRTPLTFVNPRLRFHKFEGRNCHGQCPCNSHCAGRECSHDHRRIVITRCRPSEGHGLCGTAIELEPSCRCLAGLIKTESSARIPNPENSSITLSSATLLYHL